MKPLYPHQPIAKLDSLSLALGLTTSELLNLASAADDFFILQKEILKADGSKRQVYDVKPELKRVHEKIKAIFLKQIKYPSFLHGSLKGKDYLSNIKQHTGQRVVISEDVSNFFPSISSKVVHEVWAGVFGFSNEVASCLTKLVTLNGFLVQGAKPSSYLCNLVLWSREARLVSNFERKGYSYTRYVDDITISSPNNIGKDEVTDIITKTYSMLKTIGAKPNRQKHKVMPNGRNQAVHRVNVNSGTPTLPKKERQKIKAAVYECEQAHTTKSPTPAYRTLFNRTMGRVNNLKRIHPSEGLNLSMRLSMIKPT
ncbi:reverse transcriptase family protein [Shewanella sp. SW36]|uniref:reverse transcriptase family protein n=1 Tax=unclassified Shewanella TaxID=196818 RepID=UPI0021D9410A|nr:MULTISPECIES: reverse transcriptase family protein [unclassified Shewanella]MCU7976265.1 reverse transcriptase family protein [Shewanella sp. SW36]MCU7991505.1 reverse transcriptase family protein [Shewanella sp. SW1]MCU8052325.1 reverse transcriptase family protein [Shewanella sp. SM43]